MEKRYVATIDFFVFAESDEQAIEKAKEFCKSQDRIKDNKCSLAKLEESKFGVLTNRPIYISE